MWRWTLASLVCLVAVTSPARADVVIPPHPEPCNLSGASPHGKECVVCWLSNRQDPGGCRSRYRPEGYSRVCKTDGRADWQEIWCRPIRQPEPPAVATAPREPLSTLPPLPDEPPPTEAACPVAKATAAVSPEYVASPPGAKAPGSDGVDPAAPSSPGATEPASPPPAHKSGACGACSAGLGAAPLGAAGLVLLVVAMAVLRRRRRQAPAPRSGRRETLI